MKLLLDKHLEMEINVLFQLPLTADWIRIRYLQDHEEDRQQEVGHHAQLSARGEGQSPARESHDFNIFTSVP